MSAYDYQLGRRKVETAIADTFEQEFPMVTGRSVEILSHGESPDRIALIDGIETGLELTAIQAVCAEDMVTEMHQLANKKQPELRASQDFRQSSPDPARSPFLADVEHQRAGKPVNGSHV